MLKKINNNFQLVLKNISFILVLIICSCSDKDTKEKPSSGHSGFSISNTARHGRPHFGSDSSWQSYFNITSTISNDTTIPIELDLQLEKEYRHLNKTFKLFLLPENMDVETQKRHNYYNDTIIPFMKLHEQYPTSIKKVIQPGETYLVNVSYLSPKNSDFGPGQLAVISNQYHYNFASIPDKIVQSLMEDPENLNLYLGLNFSILTDSLYGFKLVPIGTVKYINK